MPNNDFEAGRKLEKLSNKIKGLHLLINSSSDSWISELNRAAIQNAWGEYLRIANQYSIDMGEIHELEKIVRIYN